MPVRIERYIMRAMLKSMPDALFVFGDNLARRGLGGQAQEARGEPNAVGIPTKRWPGMAAMDFFHDVDDYERAKKEMDAAFMLLFCKLAHGGVVVWPEAGIGTGRAHLQARAPRIWALLEDYRAALFLIGGVKP